MFFIQFLAGVFFTVNHFYLHQRSCTFHTITPASHILFTLHNFSHHFSTHQNLFFSDIFRGFRVLIAILCVHLLFLDYMVLLYILSGFEVLFIKKQGDRSPEKHRKNDRRIIFNAKSQARSPISVDQAVKGSYILPHPEVRSRRLLQVRPFRFSSPPLRSALRSAWKHSKGCLPCRDSKR